MTDFVISDMLVRKIMVWISEDAEPDPDMLCTIDEEMRSRKLSDELKKERERVLNLLDKFTTETIKICDEPHGKLSSPSKVKGMKNVTTLLKGVINECRTEDGFTRVEESLRME